MLLREEEQEELPAEELVSACMEEPVLYCVQVEACMGELDTLYRERLQGRDVRQLQVTSLTDLHPILPYHGGMMSYPSLPWPLLCPFVLQDEIDEIGFRGDDQEEEEDVFALAEEMRRKKREENAEADAVDDDEVRY